MIACRSYCENSEGLLLAHTTLSTKLQDYLTQSDWLPTDSKRRFFLLARFYGPEPALFDGSFELNDIELVK